MTTLLETQNLSKEYASRSGTVRAVDNVSLQVAAGEFVALVGPSGSGKTTLLAMLAGLLAPTEGRIIIGGQDLAAMGEAQRTAFRRQAIGFTFQQNNLVPYLTARENVELMLRLNGRADRAALATAAELLERLGLGQHLDHLPRQLSGGQQQRVAIARALAHGPSIVLADEPTASLDSERAFQVVREFAALVREQGRVGVIVTHDLRLCQFVDRVIQMTDGRMTELSASPPTALHYPRGEGRLGALSSMFVESVG